MIAFGLHALTLENVHDMFLDKESRLLKNMNGMLMILIILVCTQITIWMDVRLYWETPREVLACSEPPSTRALHPCPRPFVPKIPLLSPTSSAFPPPLGHPLQCANTALTL